MAWGGRRPGSGRKPKPCACGQPKEPRKRLCATCLTAPRSARVLAHPSAPPTTNEPVEVEEFDAPDSLSKDERAVWMRQAPFAFKRGTLTRASALAFERYCRVVVLEQNEAKSSGVGGANHRGLLKQVNAFELQFLLTPAGRPMLPDVQAPAIPAPQGAMAKFRR